MIIIKKQKNIVFKRKPLELCQNICLLNICWYKKKINVLAWAIQKIDFGGSIWRGPKESGTPNHVKIFVS